MTEAPRFKYWAHWSNLLFWLVVGGLLWSGIALMIAGVLPPPSGEPESREGGELFFWFILGGLALLSPVGAINYFLPHYVELAPDGLSFHATWDFNELFDTISASANVTYGRIYQVRRTILGGLEIRFRGPASEEEKLADHHKTIYLLSGSERFLIELRSRFATATGKDLKVVRYP